MNLILGAAVDRREHGALTTERLEAIPQPLEQRFALLTIAVGHLRELPLERGVIPAAAAGAVKQLADGEANGEPGRGRR
jgi:hypothetical protein